MTSVRMQQTDILAWQQIDNDVLCTDQQAQAPLLCSNLMYATYNFLRTTTRLYNTQY